MSYSVGNLHLALTGIDRSASKSIDNVIKKLNQLNSALSVFSEAKMSKTSETFNKLFNNGGGKGGSGRRSNTSGGGGIGSLFNIAKITSTIYLTRRLAHTVGGVIQKGSEYTETLNLWQVAMRDNLDLADKFITKMNKAYGISEKTLMNAQAVFKNMIGSLGQVSDQTAYLLSETLIQMSVDFASLYNTTLQQAFSKIQAMLAGQVRPIRSAGLDMTETTLFMYYQQMGGTKTMRQLNRTEKQLLSIYAVFEQMGKAGALGDMTKTLNTFANQTRITAEAWEELMTWTGVVVKHLIQESGLITNINAVLITMGEIMKAVANSMGAMDEDWSGALFENVTETNGALDEMQGKLLDFDKFRSLQGQGENFLGIDEKLLQAITGYDSLIEKSNNKAREQAEIWLKNLGFIWDAEKGVYELTDRAKIFLGVLKFIGNLLLTIVSLNILKKIKALTFSLLGLKGTNIVAWLQNIQLQGALANTRIDKLTVAFDYLKVAVVAAGISFALFDSIISMLDGDAKKTMSWISILVGGLGTILGLILAIKGGLKGGLLGASIAGLGVGALIAGIKGIVKKEATDTNFFKDGGMPEKGSMFVAGEAGAEIVYNAPSGQSGVANIKQIEQAMYGALVAYGRTQGNSNNSSRPIEVYVDGERMFTTMGNVANRHGVGFAKK